MGKHEPRVGEQIVGGKYTIWVEPEGYAQQNWDNEWWQAWRGRISWVKADGKRTVRKSLESPTMTHQNKADAIRLSQERALEDTKWLVAHRTEDWYQRCYFDENPLPYGRPRPRKG